MDSPPETKTIPGHFEKIRGWVVDQIGQSAITWLLGVLGSLVIAGLVAFRERILGIPADVYLYGVVVIVSATLFFLLGEFKGLSAQTLNPPAAAAIQSSSPVTTLKVEVSNSGKTLSLGEVWNPVAGRWSITIELEDVLSSNEATMTIATASIQYYGRHVIRLGENPGLILGSRRYKMPRRSTGWGDYAVSYWDFSGDGFDGFFITCDHINAHTKTVSMIVQVVSCHK